MVKKKIIAIVSVYVVILGICAGLLYKPLCEVHSIPNFSNNGNVVYTPKGDHLPVKFHVTLFCIDNYMHWVYKLNDEEQNEVLEDIENENWTLLNESIFMKIKDFDGFYGGSEILKKRLLDHECYVCVFDPNKEQIITNEDEYFMYHSEWVIFLYDTQACKYYCIYATI